MIMLMLTTDRVLQSWKVSSQTKSLASDVFTSDMLRDTMGRDGDYYGVNKTTKWNGKHCEEYESTTGMVTCSGSGFEIQGISVGKDLKVTIKCCRPFMESL